VAIERTKGRIVTNMNVAEEPHPEIFSNDVTELDRQHHWDIEYQHGRAASKLEWDAEHHRRESHELRKYPRWRLGPDQKLIEHGPKVTAYHGQIKMNDSHGDVKFGADEAALWCAERPAGRI